MTYTIEVPDTYTPPDFTRLFDFIDSQDSQRFLSQAERGELSFRSCFDILREHNALPYNVAFLVWACVLSMYEVFSGRPDTIKHCALVARSPEYRLGLHKARGVFEYEE